MEFLTRLLDDPDPRPCGRCANCTGEGLPRNVDDELVRAAVSFLRRDLRSIKPRLQWPTGAVDGPERQDHATERGRHGPVRLRRCRLGSGRPAREVRRRGVQPGARRRVGPGDPRALAPGPGTDLGHRPAIDREARPRRRVRALDRGARSGYRTWTRSRSSPAPLPRRRWRTVPSSSATRSTSSGCSSRPCCDGPVLLVDDIVDSGWTLTVAGHLLRTHGSGPVYPFVLAVASARDG